MRKPRPAPATYADIEALPPNMVGEIIFRALHTRPRPAPRHGLAAALRTPNSVTAPPFEVHTFPLDGLWVGDEPAAAG